MPSERILAGERAALLAHHWLRAEDWEKALNYTLEAADGREALYARTETINHYWQALDLFERLPAMPNGTASMPMSSYRRCCYRVYAGRGRQSDGCYGMSIERSKMQIRRQHRSINKASMAKGRFGTMRPCW